MDACCYEVEGRMLFMCSECDITWDFGYSWKSTDDIYVRLECPKCDEGMIISMLKLLSPEWVEYIPVIQNTWDYVTSRPENKEAIEGKVTWQIVTK